MAFQVKTNEPVGQGIVRNVRNQIEKALKHLGAKEALRPDGASENEAVFEVRKCFKRVRAALRLAREELGEDLYHEENWRLRDAARPLTQVRDAQVLVETADELRRQFPEAVEPGAFEKIREALLANRRQVSRVVLGRGRAFAKVADAATRTLGRVADWRLQPDGGTAIETGLRRVYRTGRRALALAAENPSVENLHELRKQAKYLWHQLQLLEVTLTEEQRSLAGQAHELSTLLGRDHDLTVLRETLAADPLAYGGHRILKSVFAAIDCRRQELVRQAFDLGRGIYEAPPRAFVNAIGASAIGASMSSEEVA